MGRHNMLLKVGSVHDESQRLIVCVQRGQLPRALLSCVPGL